MHQTGGQWKSGSHAYSHGLPPDHCREQHHHLLQEPGLASLHGSGKSTGKTELGAVAVDTVGGVQVLNDHDLEASGATLAGSNDGPCKEEFPNLQEVVSMRQTVALLVERRTYPEPALTVLGLDGIDVAEPVAVPSPESSGVVHTNGVNAAEKLSVIVCRRNSYKKCVKLTS